MAMVQKQNTGLKSDKQGVNKFTFIMMIAFTQNFISIGKGK